MKQRQPRWRQEEAPLLAASTQAQTRWSLGIPSSRSLGREGGGRVAEATKNDIQCQRLHSKASGAWGMRPPPGRSSGVSCWRGLLSSGSFAALISQR